MNGPHDLGGRMGFGPIAPEDESAEPLFHAGWERRALGLTLCCNALGLWRLDEARHARESLPPALYLGSPYYQIWIEALERLLTRHGELRSAELAAGAMIEKGRTAERRLLAKDVAALLASGGPTSRPADQPARFGVGDRVRARNIHPRGHTRLPWYARGKTGSVAALHGAHVFPDASASGEGEQPHWLYTVTFDAAVLWGDDADRNSDVSIEAWEPYLEPA